VHLATNAGTEMRITESKLRKMIREFLSSYGTRDPYASSYGMEEPVHQPIDTKAKVSAADEEFEEGICPACHGKGTVMGRDCRLCGGTGEA